MVKTTITNPKYYFFDFKGLFLNMISEILQKNFFQKFACNGPLSCIHCLIAQNFEQVGFGRIIIVLFIPYVLTILSSNACQAALLAINGMQQSLSHIAWKYCRILLLCLGILPLAAQPAKIDSLSRLLSTLPQDTNRVKVLGQIAFALSGTDPVRTREYANEALVLAEQLNFTSGISRAYNVLAITYRMEGDYRASLQMFLKALAIDEKHQRFRAQAQTLNGIGAVYMRMGEYETALHYFQQGLATFQKHNIASGLGSSYGNLGQVYEKLGQTDKAMDYLRRSIQADQQLGFESPTAYPLHQIGLLHLHQHRLDSALVYLFKSLEIKERNKNVYGAAESCIAISDCYISKGNPETALAYARKALQMALALPAAELELQAARVLARGYEHIGNHQRALDYYRKHIELKDSIFAIEKTRQITLLQKQYEHEKREHENQQLRQQQAISEQKLRVQQLISMAILSFFIILAGSAFVLYRSKKRIEYQNSQLQHQKEEILAQRDNIEGKNTELQQQKEEILAQRDNIERQHRIISAARQELEEANAKLRHVNVYLEKAVNERTADLTKAKETLERVNGELDTFIYRSYHDFKGPLARMKGLVNLGRRMSTGDAAMLEVLDMVLFTTAQMEAMQSKLVMVNYLHKRQFAPQRIDPHEIFDRVRQQLYPFIVQSNIKLDCEVIRPFAWQADPELCYILLLNLIENAIHFRTGDDPFCKLTVRQQDEWICIDIQDNGIGIREDIHDKVYDIFFRGHEQSQGNGLGLYVARSVLEEVGGTISFQSQEGAGTIWHVRWPSVTLDLR